MIIILVVDMLSLLGRFSISWFLLSFLDLRELWSLWDTW